MQLLALQALDALPFLQWPGAKPSWTLAEAAELALFLLRPSDRSNPGHCDGRRSEATCLEETAVQTAMHMKNPEEPSVQTGVVTNSVACNILHSKLYEMLIC